LNRAGNREAQRPVCPSVRAALLIVLSSSLAVAAPRVRVDRIAAVVNEQVILVSEVELRLAQLRAQLAEVTDPAERERRLARMSSQVLDAMIDDELVLQAAIERKITIEADEVQQAIDFIKQSNKLDDAQLAAAMKEQGVTRATLKNDLLRQRAISQLVMPKINITDEDALAYYDQLQRRSDSVTAVDVSQIVFAIAEHASEQAQQAAMDKARRALARIRGGEDFAAVARDVSEDAGTRTGGGALGWLDVAGLSSTWEPVVVAMDKGEVRGPIAGPAGLYLLRANEVKRTELKPFPAMRDGLVEQLRRKAVSKQTESWIAELRKRAYVDIKVGP
jgi:peptidyl-prolyl cis-trans isomerase SurA